MNTLPQKHREMMERLAEQKFNEWNDVTGFVVKNTSYHGELVGLMMDAAQALFTHLFETATDGFDEEQMQIQLERGLPMWTKLAETDQVSLIDFLRKLHSQMLPKLEALKAGNDSYSETLAIKLGEIGIDVSGAYDFDGLVGHLSPLVHEVEVEKVEIERDKLQSQLTSARFALIESRHALDVLLRVRSETTIALAESARKLCDDILAKLSSANRLNKCHVCGKFKPWAELACGIQAEGDDTWTECKDCMSDATRETYFPELTSTKEVKTNG